MNIVSAAIEKARKKAVERSLSVDFIVWDALRLRELKRHFETVMDSGLFHTLSNEERPVFAKELAAVLNPGGRYFMLCFSEHEPGSWGPRRVTQKEIRDTFRLGWQVHYIREMRFDTNLGTQCCKGWLSSITLLDRDAAEMASPSGGMLI